MDFLRRRKPSSFTSFYYSSLPGLNDVVTAGHLEWPLNNKKCYSALNSKFFACIARAECDGTRAETRFRLSPKRMSPFKSVGASVQSTAGSRAVRISLSNAG